MTTLQTPARLQLKALAKAAWDGNVTITPVLPPDKPVPNKPSKKVGDTVLISSGDQYRLLVSLGDKDKLTSAKIRQAGAATANWLIGHHVTAVGLKTVGLQTQEIEDSLNAFLEGLLSGAFRFERHKSGEDEALEAITVNVLVDNVATAEPQVEAVSNLMTGVNLTREWSHEPPNIINPVTLVERAKALAKESGLKCTIFNETKLQNMGAGAILSVGLGSKTPSQMILLEHRGPGTTGRTKPVVVVGKAITFDTGGYSLKPVKGMGGMKFDKCGGMTVVGVLQAAAALDLPVRVIGIVAAAENMVSAEAYRPSDIITSLAGKTIEIISTDAEGRMVLADALTYASTKLKPRAIIDLATLTGGVVTALGKFRAGVMATDDELVTNLIAAGDRTGEKLWQLPLDDEYFELIKGSDSDMKNSAGVPLASSIVGGTFLKQFVLNDVPWAHIDIAGTATVEKGISGGRAATGFGVRLVVEYLKGLS